MERIYLDHAATSPLLPGARDAMLRWIDCGNPSSLYAEGRAAKLAIDEAREAVAEELGCAFAEIVFTSGGSEGAALAILGTAFAEAGAMRILLGAAEHHCVLNTKAALERLGFQVDLIPVDREARIDLQALSSMIGPDVRLVSVMHANNELGSLNEIARIAEIVHAAGGFLHTDAVQSFGKVPFSVGSLGADLMSISGHKIGAPKGVGVLFVRAGVRLKPLIAGGGQERELRAGTENVAAIAGFGAAVKIPHDYKTSALARDHLRLRLVELGAVPSLSKSLRSLPNHLHVRFPGVSAESLLILLDRMGLCAGSGAACSSGSIQPSHVMLAAGYSIAEAKEGLRLSFGQDPDDGLADAAADRIGAALDQIRR